MEGMEKKKKLPVVRYMVYMLIITAAVTMVSLSRYSTSSSMGDTSKVAGFNVVITHDNWNVNGHPNKDVYSFGAGTTGGTKVYTFTVKNFSEVTVKARLVVDSADQTVTYNPAWFNVPIGGAPQTVTATVPQGVGFSGNDVSMHIEYEQVD